MHIYVGHPPGQTVLQKPDDAGFGGDTGKMAMFLPRPYNGL